MRVGVGVPNSVGQFTVAKVNRCLLLLDTPQFIAGPSNDNSYHLLHLRARTTHHTLPTNCTILILSSIEVNGI